MYNQKELEERFKRISEKVEKSGTNMNSMLAPEFCECSAEKQTSKIRYRAMDWERNQRGEVHGGAVAAMFDTAIGFSISAFSFGEEKITTTDLDVSYIRPFLGDSYIFHVELLHIGRTMIRARAVAYDEFTDKKLASATANFMYIKR